MGDEDFRVKFAVLENKMDNVAARLETVITDHESRLRSLEEQVISPEDRGYQAATLRNHEKMLSRMETTQRELVRQVRQHDEGHKKKDLALYAVILGVLAEAILISMSLGPQVLNGGI